MNSEFPLDISISLYCSDLWHLTKWQFIAEIQHWFCIRELVHWICCINRLIQQMKIKHTLWETSQQPGIGKELPQLHRSHIKKKSESTTSLKLKGWRKAFCLKWGTKQDCPLSPPAVTWERGAPRRGGNLRSNRCLRYPDDGGSASVCTVCQNLSDSNLHTCTY